MTTSSSLLLNRKNDLVTISIIKKLFIDLSVIFGNRFTNLYPTSTTLKVAEECWLKSLNDLSPSDLASGIDFYLKNIVDFVPTPAEFRAKCIEKSKIVNKIDPFFKAPPFKKGSIEVAEKYLDMFAKHYGYRRKHKKVENKEEG